MTEIPHTTEGWWAIIVQGAASAARRERHDNPSSADSWQEIADIFKEKLYTRAFPSSPSPDLPQQRD